MTHNPFREAIESGTFVVTAEAIPGRGACEVTQEKTQREVREIWDAGLVQAVSVTDAPSGTPALLADEFARSLREQGITPLVHFTCKDRNRNQIEAQLYAMQRNGIENLLCMTGDAPSDGWQGQARPVFDLDPVTMVQMVCDMNAGMGHLSRSGVITTEPANFFPGVVVSPFKWTEGEVMTQLIKLQKKVAAGAKFIICQLGYDMRKQQEILWLMRDAGIDVPLIANIYVLNAGTAAFMNRGGIPGCTVTDELLATLRSERDNSDDKGAAASFDRAAKMIAAAKGMGCAGVHLAGAGVNAETVSAMLAKAAEYEKDWEAAAAQVMFSPKDCFWYYQEDPATHLNQHVENPRNEDLFSIRKIRGNFRLSHLFHKLVFIPGKPLNKVFTSFEQWRDRKKGPGRKHSFEHLGKVVLYDCMDCGDCGLYATGYTCPMTQCPKSQRNGPCGGSENGWCEVYPGEKYCIWYRAYYRTKHYGEESKLASYIVPPNQWAHWQKSPWGNMVMGRDSYARREWLEGHQPDTEFLEGPQADPNAPHRY